MRKYLLILSLLCLLFSCNNNKTDKDTEYATAKDTIPSSKDTVPTIEKVDTITAFKNRQDSIVIFKSLDGRLYKTALIEGDEDSVESFKAALNCNDDNFSGVDRKIAKTSISSGQIQSLSFGQFLSGLIPDQDMIDKNISKDKNSNRVKDEKRNVRLENVFLYAIKRESDNDFHIIIGNQSGTKFFNIENSGLPNSSASAFQKLKSVRKTIEDFFGGELCSTKYRMFEPGVPITVEGSLFYDVDHKPGVVGPEGFKPKTSWEIHPITKIVFE
jgi:hypothetical protein